MLAIRWIILYTMRTPLDRILVLVRQEHHNAVSLEALWSPAIRTSAGRPACSRIVRRMPISRWVGSSSVERLDAACPS